MSIKKSTRNLVTGAVIAAAYVCLTFISNIFGIAYGPVQLRISEVLTVLPVFSPVAVPGLAIGCFIANIASFNPADMIFGTAATALAAVLTYKLRNIHVATMPLLSVAMPVIINAFAVGAEISLLWTDAPAAFSVFLLSALWIGIGECAVCFGLGIPLILAIRKNEHLRSFLE